MSSNKTSGKDCVNLVISGEGNGLVSSCDESLVLKDEIIRLLNNNHKSHESEVAIKQSTDAEISENKSSLKSKNSATVKITTGESNDLKTLEIGVPPEQIDTKKATDSKTVVLIDEKENTVLSESRTKRKKKSKKKSSKGVTVLEQKDEIKLSESVVPQEQKDEVKSEVKLSKSSLPSVMEDETIPSRSFVPAEKKVELKPSESSVAAEKEDKMKTLENKEVIMLSNNTDPSARQDEKKATESAISSGDKSQIYASKSTISHLKKDETKPSKNGPYESKDEAKPSENGSPAENKDEIEPLKSAVPSEKKDELKLSKIDALPIEENEIKSSDSAIRHKKKRKKRSKNIGSHVEKDERIFEDIVKSEQKNAKQSSEVSLPSKQKNEKSSSKNTVPEESSSVSTVPDCTEQKYKKTSIDSFKSEQKVDRFSKDSAPVDQQVKRISEDAVTSEQKVPIFAEDSLPRKPSEKADISVKNIEKKSLKDVVSLDQNNEIERKDRILSKSTIERDHEEQIPSKQKAELNKSQVLRGEADMELCEDENYPERRQIEYARIAWNIENLSLSDMRSYCVKSSPFRIDASSEDLWYLGLEWSPNSALNERKVKQEKREKERRERSRKREQKKIVPIPPFEDPRFVLLHLVKLPNKAKTTDSVRVSFRFGYKTLTGVINWLAPQHTHFGKNHRKHTPNVIAIKNFQVNYVFICELAIYNPLDERNATFPLEVWALKGVEHYLRNMWITRKYCDLTIQLKDDYISAHTYILRVRSEFFRDKIEENSASNIIDLTSEYRETMDQLLYYIYTGDIVYIAEMGRLSFDLLDCARRLKVRGLENLLHRNAVELYTTCPGMMIEYHWVLKNFYSFNDAVIRQSPQLESTPTETVFKNKVKYRLRFVKNKRVIGLYAEVTCDTETDVLAEISLLDENNANVYARIFAFTFPNIFFAGESDFATVDSNDYYSSKVIKDGNLTVSLRFIISHFNYTSRTEMFGASGITDLASFSSLNKLSEDMATVLKDGRGTDLILKTEGKEFLVHKTVLSSISIAFLTMTAHLEFRETLDVKTVPANVLEVVIKFLYTEKLDETDVYVLYGIYFATKVYDAGYLNRLCFNRLKSSFNKENVCELLYRNYMNSNDPEFEQAAVDFICCNAATILLSEDWKKLKSRSIFLRDKVLNNLTKAFRDKQL